jgi:capsular exopolysaccharide synthesis family protein
VTQASPSDIDPMNNEASHQDIGHSDAGHYGDAASGNHALMVRDYEMHGLSPYVAPGYGGAYVEGTPGGLNFSQLLHALRRRWLLALVAGLMVGVPLAALLWLVAPQNYEVVAWLRVGAPQQWSSTPGSWDASEYEPYRQSQAALIRSPVVLVEALNKEGISSLPLLRSEKEQRRFLEDEITVVTPRDSQLLQIRMRGKDPQQLVKIVNAVKDSYIDNVVEVENRESVQKLHLLENTLGGLQTDISNKHDALQKLQEKTSSADLDSVKLRESILIHQSTTIMDEMSRAHEDLAKVEKQLLFWKSENDKPSSVPEYLVELALSHDDKIADLTKQAGQYEQMIALETQASKLKDRDPKVKEYKNTLAGIQQRLDDKRRELRPQIVKHVLADQSTEAGEKALDPDRLEIAKTQIEDNLKRLSKNLDDVSAETAKLGNASGELSSLQEEIRESEREREKLQSQLNDVRLSLQLPSRVRVLNDASVPDAPSEVFRIVVTAFAGILGLLLGSGTVVAMEYQAKRLNTSTELGAQTGLRVLGTVPNLEVLSRAKGVNGAAAMQGILAESVDSIRTMLLRQSRDGAPHVILVTSAGDREGKTTVASHLAASLARSGRRTLLIDGDLRAPTVHAMFSATLEPGLCEILRGEVELEGAIQSTPVDGLMLVAAGACDYQAIASLAKDSLKDVLDKTREQFEFIVLDAAPVLTYADTLLMGVHSDAAILSVRRDVSQLQKVHEARERMESVGVKVLGAVVNGITETSRRPAYALPSPT